MAKDIAELHNLLLHNPALPLPGRKIKKIDEITAHSGAYDGKNQWIIHSIFLG